jgi:hypothetical protein
MAAARRQWRAHDVEKATGVPRKMLDRWLDRGIIKLSDDDHEATSSGDYRGFSRRTIHKFAITFQLNRLGFYSRSAASRAAAFSDRATPGRAPGALFPDSETIMVVAPDDTRIIRVAAGCTADDALATAGLDRSLVSLVDIGRIVRDVDPRLGA